MTTDASGGHHGPPAVVSNLSAIDSRHYLVYGLELWSTSDAGGHWTKVSDPGYSVPVAGDHDWLVVGAPRREPIVLKTAHQPCYLGVDVLYPGAHRLQERATVPGVCGVESVGRSGRNVFASATHLDGAATDLVSADDGQVWLQRQTLPYCFGSQALLGEGALAMVCAGAPGTPYPTTTMGLSPDNGRHWRRVATPQVPDTAVGLAGQSPSLLWRYGPDTAVYRGTDDGRHWTAMLAGRIGGPKMPQLQAFSARGDRAWAISTPVGGGNPVAYETRDAGDHWSGVALPEAPRTWAVAATLIGPYSGAVLVKSCANHLWSWRVDVTTDGATWRPGPALVQQRIAPSAKCSSLVQDRLWGVIAVDARHLFAYGNGMWASSDAGVTWRRTAEPGPVTSAATDGHDLWVVCADCVIGTGSRGSAVDVLSADGGLQRPVFRLPMDHQTATEVYRSGSTAYLRIDDVVDGHALLVTTDDGRHWTGVGRPLGCPSPSLEPSSLLLLDPRHLVETCAALLGAGSEPKRLYGSEDAGRHWTLVAHLEQGGYADGLSGNLGTLWRSGGRAPVFRSTDGGRHWVALLTTRVGDDGKPLQAFAADGQRAWAVATAADGGLPVAYETHDAGRHWATTRVP